MPRKNTPLFVTLWLPKDPIPMEKYLATCIRVASPGRTVFVALDHKGAVRAIISTRLRVKPALLKWALVTGDIWLTANAKAEKIQRRAKEAPHA